MTTRIAFHSYKGGAGRSTGLTNVAYILAARGNKVGVIDLDIEAAGLMTIFSPTPEVFNRGTSVQKYLEKKRESEGASAEDFVIQNVEKRLDLFRPSPFKPTQVEEGELHLFLSDLNAEQVGEMPSEMELISIFGDLFDEFEEVPDTGELDYLLIDGRSGIGALVIPAVVHADEIAEFFRWSNQHQRGIEQSVKWLDNYLEAVGTDGKVYPVASSVPLRDNPEDLGEVINEESIEDWLTKESSSENDPIMEKERVDDFAIIPESPPLKIKEEIILDDNTSRVSNEDIGSELTAEIGYRQLADNLED